MVETGLIVAPRFVIRRYEKGAVTLFGVNMADEKIRLNLKVNIKEEEIHKYILTEGKDPATGER